MCFLTCILHLQLQLVCGSFCIQFLHLITGCFTGLRSGDWLSHYPIALTSETVGLLLWCAFGALSICTVKCCLIGFGAFGWIWVETIALYKSQFTLLLLSSVYTSVRDPLVAIHAHAITSLQWQVVQLAMFDRWSGVPWIISCFSSFSFSLLVRVCLYVICLKSFEGFFAKKSRTFRCFLAKSCV